MNIYSYTHTSTRRSAMAPDQNTDGDDISKSSIMRKKLRKLCVEKIDIFVKEIEITAIHDDDTP